MKKINADLSHRFNKCYKFVNLREKIIERKKKLSKFHNLFQNAVQRDPRKRRVKPVQKHLIQVDFGGADDSDDSDFELDKHKKGTHNK